MSQKGAQDIRQRAYQYALRAIKLYQHLQEQRDGAGWILAKQYLRAATSIGANIEEAQASESRADFIHRFGIAQRKLVRAFTGSDLSPSRTLYRIRV